MFEERQRLILLYPFLAAISLLFSIFLGNSDISTGQLIHALHVEPSDLSHQILFSIRIPHALTVFVTGGLLALAGVLMQVLVRNPLADPYILGTSSGAACMTLLLMLMGASGLILNLGAALGSFLAILFVFGFSQRKGIWQPQTLLLTGIALACGLSALVSLMIFISPDPTLRGMLFWLVGDFSDTSMPWFSGLVLVAGCAYSVTHAREFNLLIRGEKAAAALGVETRSLHWKLYFLSAIFTATAVNNAGCIGFVGLVVPHLFRLSVGYDHRLLLPGAVILGGGLLTLADLIARHVLFPLELPVGIIMALLGTPIFLFILRKKCG